ncbi:MAG: glycosyltransferase family 2 protein [Kiritimatiellae bacterium]|nr:glycosyltransferase family 2 protein [Kiritimatiellia bacterium]
MNPFVSVITLTHNKIDYTKRCLSSLLKTSYIPWELVIVDNGSTDGTVEWLKKFRITAEESGVSVALVLNDSNIGCSTARNLGSERARGERLVFVDNDVALRSKTWLTQMGSCLDRHPDAGIVGLKLVYPYKPHPIQCAGAAISPSGRIQFTGRGEQRDDPLFNTECEMQCLISACFMLKRSVMTDTGGFDEAFNPVEYEDIDLCYNAREKGYKIFYTPSAEMYHFESVTTAGTPALPNTYLIIKNGVLFKKRWKHMFENENGPSDKETLWRDSKTYTLDDIEDLPTIE